MAMDRSDAGYGYDFGFAISFLSLIIAHSYVAGESSAFRTLEYYIQGMRLAIFHTIRQ